MESKTCVASLLRYFFGVLRSCDADKALESLYWRNESPARAEEWTSDSHQSVLYLEMVLLALSFLFDRSDSMCTVRESGASNSATTSDSTILYHPVRVVKTSCVTAWLTSSMPSSMAYSRAIAAMSLQKARVRSKSRSVRDNLNSVY